MNKKITLQSLTDAFYEEGEACDFGCHQNELDNVWLKVSGMARYKSVFAVKNWMWFDMEMDGQQLAIVKADHVVRTSNRKFDIGDWVRTSPLVNFMDKCVFETSNSYYILVGKGTRKESDHSIFNFIG